MGIFGPDQSLSCDDKKEGDSGRYYPRGESFWAGRFVSSGRKLSGSLSE